jgi:pimeloyl-ACP methyl ester carboxylesterase
MARVYQPDPRARFVEANGLRFAYLEWGEGPTVLFFHGFPDTAHGWEQIGPGLAAAGFRAIAPFLRGYAPSAMPDRDTDSRTLGEDVLALVAAFGGKARVIGHDWGAESVYAAASLASGQIVQLVAVGVPHRANIQFTPALVWGIRHFVTLALPGAEGRFARGDFAEADTLCRRWSPTWKFGTSDLEAAKNAFAAPGCAHAAIGYYRAAAFRLPQFMRTPISIPTLVIAGLDDPNLALPAYERPRAQFRSSYEIKGIPGGHFCHRESPQAFLDAVVPFLRHSTQG